MRIYTPRDWSYQHGLQHYYTESIHTQINLTHVKRIIMKSEIILKIADICTTPGGRSIVSGSYSAEWFYSNHLLPAYKQAVAENTSLTVDLDGTEGYAGSYLDELFGRLAWENKDTIKDMLVDTELSIISTEEPYLVDDIIQSMHEWVTEGPHDNSPIVTGK